jgi:hypothetical protein
MLRYRGPAGYAKKVLIVCERRVNERTGEVWKDKERMYHSPEAAAEWWSRFAVHAWCYNFHDKHGRVATAQERKARAKKYKRRALPIFKAKFDALI